MESTVYHPRANGLAERAAQTVKRALQAWSSNFNVSFGAFMHGGTDDTSQHFKAEEQRQLLLLHHQKELEQIFHTALKLNTEYSRE